MITQQKPGFPGSFNYLLSLILLPLLCMALASCQITYYLKSAYHQAKLLKSRVDIEEAIKSSTLSQENKQKLLLATEARVFAENSLKLKKTKNYTSFVQLDRPYVSYILRAAPIYELKHYLWSFPIVGDLPYKGYFSEEEAKSAAKDFSHKEYDTYVRGVTAYSTLGYFNDPILSSMLRYQNHDLVNTIIHETVHATIYIKNNADFNERLATFIGNKGAELFYLKKEGADSKTLLQIKSENQDSKVFSSFMSDEIRQLKKWYTTNKDQVNPKMKKDRLNEIQSRFIKDIKPQLKNYTYKNFTDEDLNNAKILSYQTYIYDLNEFEALYKILDSDFAKLIEYCKKLEGTKDPQKELSSFVGFHQTHEEHIKSD